MSNEDPVLRYIGNFGKWQARIIGIVPFVGFFCAWQILCTSFVLPGDLSYWCLPENFPFEPSSATWTSPPVLNPVTGNPELDANNDTVLDVCLMYELEYKDLVNKPNTSGLSTTACTSWEYDRTQYPQTLISQFDLVCENQHLQSLLKSVYMSGLMVGALVTGILSDKYGRKTIMLIFSCGVLVFGVSVSFSPSIEVFFVLRWCVAFCSVASYSSGYVYCVEIVGGKWSTIVGIGFQFPFSLGYMTLPLVAWLLPAWNHLMLVISIPIILLIIPVAIPALIPESPRWMLFNGNSEEAIDLLESAAKLNQRPVQQPQTIMEDSSSSPKTDLPSASFLDLFRTPRLRSRTLIMWYIWFTNNMVYYGISLNAGHLIPGNIYINFAIMGALEIPAHMLTILILLYLGRRWSLSCTMALAGVALLFTVIAPGEIGKNICAHIGKFLITCSYDIAYVYVVEIFPTVVRGVGLGSSSMFARMGGILAPYIGHELNSLYKDAPCIIFGLISLLAGLLTLVLPETNNKVLPDTIQEGEQFGEDQSLLPKCCQKIFSRCDAEALS